MTHAFTRGNDFFKKINSIDQKMSLDRYLNAMGFEEIISIAYITNPQGVDFYVRSYSAPAAPFRLRCVLSE